MEKQKFLTDVEVANRYKVHKVTIWRWAKNNKIPIPVKISDRCTRWKLRELEKWEEKLSS
jgi:prophage regulatory protein